LLKKKESLGSPFFVPVSKLSLGGQVPVLIGSARRKSSARAADRELRSLLDLFRVTPEVFARERLGA